MEAIATCRMSNPPRHTLVAAELAELAAWVEELKRGATSEWSSSPAQVRASSSRTTKSASLPTAPSGKRTVHAASNGHDAAAYVPPFSARARSGAFRDDCRDQRQRGRRWARVRARLRFSARDGWRVPTRSARDVGRHHSGRRRHATLRATCSVRRRRSTSSCTRRRCRRTKRSHLGIVHRVYARDEFADSVHAFAQDLAARAPIALAAAKRAIYEGAELSLEQGLAVEQREFARCMASEDAAVRRCVRC